ncbi:receptor-type tyrosine-protein phosphatase kappa-like [Ylistrum balloti]|uniref:receptor-type tyrosine-protein phosphatase kappa-like n=1 Tax=Ylistrum balloti TaxID=509963 RepID=UPI002905F62C|nr:receptor-type tyrosine-protein phosphatase kappa-like [Ylistrum balloti]
MASSGQPQYQSPVLDMFMWWMFISWMVRYTMANPCPMGTFGDLCQYKCHCEFGAACTPTTGECFAGCEEGYIGKPTCQIKNVALGKETDQNGDTTVTSSLVVDGDRRQDGSTYGCSRAIDTKYPFIAWWYVDLGQNYSLNRIKIYFRNDLAINKPRREGVRVYVTSSPLDFNANALCYKDILKPDGIIAPPDLLDLRNCTTNGRYVIVYNERPLVDPMNCPTTTYSCWANLEICEVEVFACTEGTFGDNCDKFCHCKNGTCDPNTGICPGGECQEGWMGEQCDIGCPDGKYGIGCNQTCGKCRNGDVCETMFGTCPNGCEPGFDGPACKDSCPDFRYGQTCLGKCDNCANNTDCDKVSGFCPGRCDRGWHGVRCDERCPAGMFGGKCDKRCGQCRGGDQCDFSTGQCPSGCKPGYVKPQCIEICPKGTFGGNCSRKCSTCKMEICHHVTGSCNNGCKAGWTGPTCLQPCGQGHFGENCGRSCDHCRDRECNHVTGLCVKGCVVGWRNPRCDQMCPPGTFGSDCSAKCGTCANDAACHHGNGLCLEGCAEGWNGTRCDRACASGTYGLQCARSCGQCKNGTICHHVTGMCKLGCSEGFVGPNCGRKSVDTETDVVLQSAIIGGALALVCIVGIIVLICIARQWKRKLQVQKKEEEEAQVDSENNYANIHNTTYENANINNGYVDPDGEVDTDIVRYSGDSSTYVNGITNMYYNVGAQLPGVSLNNYSEYVQEMEEDHTRYTDEFDELRNRPTYMHIEGQKKQNKLKNRFLTTFPYDHSRVILDKLPCEPDSDYINANYIDGVDSLKAYIATQGPNRHTVGDIWRMIWQHKVDSIVMLANLVEDGKVKCECYWPTIQPVTYNNLTVTRVNKTEMAMYTVRTFIVTNTELSETRQVTQYHFTGWPDHGVPDTLELVAFLMRVLQDNPSRTDDVPLLVHCSAGVGRTGTFIGLHALYTYGCDKKRVDVAEFVRKMRDNRMLMVQNIEQYRLLHIALLEAFNYTESTIKKSDFLKRYNDCVNKQSNIITKEFELLQSAKPVYSEQHFTAARAAENCEKNRSNKILAVDKFRPYLNTYIEGTTDYINASIVPSCKAQGRFIVTQAPLPETIVDFWRLVYDHDCYTIIVLNSPDQELEGCVGVPQESGVWWPSMGDSVSYGSLTITTTAVKDVGKDITEKMYDIKKKGFGEARAVKSYHMGGWTSGQYKPVSIETLLELIDLMEAWKRKCLCHTVAVQCTDGALCSGVYCAVSLALDGLRLEQQVDIYHTLRRLHVRRPEFVRTEDQYRFIYDVIAEYIESRGIYGNT